MKQLLIFILTTGALSTWAVPKLDCGPAAAQKLIEAMPDMGASSYAPERYGFLRSTCGTAENGDYCLGRDMENSLQDPVYDEAAASYAEGLRLCGVTPNEQGRLQTGEIRCRPDPQPTCRIFAPDASNHASWGHAVATAPATVPEPETEVVPEAPSRPEAVEQEPQPSRLDRAGRVAGQGARVVGRGIVQGGRLIGRGIMATGRWIGRQTQKRGTENDQDDEDEVEEEAEEEDEEETAERPEQNWGEGW